MPRQYPVENVTWHVQRRLSLFLEFDRAGEDWGLSQSTVLTENRLSQDVGELSAAPPPPPHSKVR